MKPLILAILLLSLPAGAEAPIKVSMLEARIQMLTEALRFERTQREKAEAACRQ